MRNAPRLAAVPAVPVPPAAAALVGAGLAARIAARAEAVDAAAAFPADDIAELAAEGLLAAVLTPPHGAGVGLATGSVPLLLDLLRTVGAASLTVGRLVEGHVNAAKLVARYGAAAAGALLAAEVAAGRPSGVWNAATGDGLRATRVAGGWQLDGRKIHCSGAGSLRRPLVTAQAAGEDGPRLFLPDLADPEVAVDLGVWRASGMRGTATGTVTFAGVVVPDVGVVGGPGDYYRSPLFSGGAWRVLAVKLGGLDRIMALTAERLTRSGRADDPVIRSRIAAAGYAHEAARLVVAEAAARAEGDGEPAAIDAYVDMARGGFEEAALAVIATARRTVGLGSFIAPDPLDRVIRDLETYLRQPFLDASRDHAAGWLLDHGGRM